MDYQGYLVYLTVNDKSFNILLECKESGRQWEGVFDEGRFKEYGSIGTLETITGILFEGFKKTASDVIIKIKHTKPTMLSIYCQTTGVIKMSWTMDLPRRMAAQVQEKLESFERKIVKYEKELIDFKNKVAELEDSNKGCVLIPGCNRHISKNETKLVFIHNFDVNTLNTYKHNKYTKKNGQMNNNVGTAFDNIIGSPTYTLQCFTVLNEAYLYPTLNGSFDGLNYLENLTSFEYYGNTQKNFEALGKCKKLLNIKIHSLNALTDISWIKDCVNVETVSFENCQNLKDISPLASLKHLQELVLSDTSVDRGTLINGGHFKIVIKWD